MWAVVEHRPVSWVVLAIVTTVLGAGLLMKYLARAPFACGGHRRWTLVTGVALGMVGFFVIPVVGLVVGFMLGVYLAELIARRDRLRAWVSTVHWLKVWLCRWVSNCWRGCSPPASGSAASY